MATPPSFTAGSVLTAAQMNAVGLWEVGNYTLSTTTNNFSSVFTSEYSHYRLIFNNVSATAGTEVRMQLRSGSTNTAVNYYQGMAYTQFSGSILNINKNNDTYWYISYANGTTGQIYGTMDLYNPQTASVKTGFSFTGMFWDAGVAGGGINTNTTQFDGFSIQSTQNLSGSIKVYGYNP